METTIENTCCFTGHRKLGEPEREIEQKVCELIEKAIKQGYKRFISGVAVGFDTIAAEQVIFLKSAGHDIKLELAIPCKDHDKYWSEKQKLRFKFIREYADCISPTTPNLPYNKHSMLLRNKYIVNESSLVIAYFNGKSSGTKNTLDYAEQTDREIWLISRN